MTFKRRVTTIACALAVALAAPAVAAPTQALAVTSAELQTQLDEAKKTLDDLGAQVASAGESLNDTIYELQQTEEKISSVRADIDARTKELEADRAQLAERVSSDYKTGGVSFLSLLVNSATFEDFVNNVYYADKISQSDSEAIAAVNSAKAELERQEQELVDLQSQQEQLKAQQESQKAELEQRQAQQKAYVDDLDEQVKQKIEEERQAELERQRREAEAARAAAEAAAREAAERASVPAPSAPSGGGSSSAGSGSSGGSASSASARSAIVNAAYSQLGVPYVYGAYSPGSALDCSGFTKYCYAAAGINIPHSASGQCGMSRSVSRANLQPGDLVFWIGGVSGSASGNHVGLYIGNDQIIHANGTRVVLDSLSGRKAYTSAGPIGL
ncbi:C40 family peptidase [Caniella muris]|uniref:C40 family peptidase n=1 Tax=Caniella muris TaxID=2941502 RepID=UPI00204180EF|nr:NlpC/P60 family protein [Caniella muris]